MKLFIEEMTDDKVIGKYTSKNAENVLREVENFIRAGERRRIDDVCEELSIFDWWNDYLSVSQARQMRQFLKEAIKLGYTGYVCFKVGASGCSNGMWASVKESTNGYSPDGPTLYRSFTPSYTYWDITDKNGKFNFDPDHEEIKTIKQLEEYIYAHRDEVYIK